MEQANKTPSTTPEDQLVKTVRLIKAYDMSQKILSDFYELTSISGLIAQGCLTYLNEISKLDLQTRITVVKEVSK